MLESKSHQKNPQAVFIVMKPKRNYCNFVWSELSPSDISVSVSSKKKHKPLFIIIKWVELRKDLLFFVLTISHKYEGMIYIDIKYLLTLQWWVKKEFPIRRRRSWRSSSMLRRTATELRGENSRSTSPTSESGDGKKTGSNNSQRRRWQREAERPYTHRWRTAQRLDPGRAAAGDWRIHGWSKDKGKDHRQTDEDSELQGITGMVLQIFSAALSIPVF